jgi:CelD/BcsL family acetyltransferase involved in cellulose biosynthesis
VKIGELSFEDFLDSKALWEDVLRRSLDNHIFLTWEWLSTWWKHYGDKRRFFLIVVTEGKKILAAAPLMYTRYNLLGLGIKKMECLTDPAADYHTFLLTKERPECVRLIMDYAEKEVADWDSIELSDVPQNSETARLLALLGPKFNFKRRVQNRCPYAKLPTKFEDYFQGLGFNLRRNLHKCERRAKKDYKVAFGICSNKEDIKREMETFFVLHQKRWQSKNQAGAFSDQRFRDFHLDVAECFAERGWLALNTITLNATPATAGYAFVYGKKLYSYLSGFDPQFSKYRIGSLRLMYLIRHCIVKGLTEYDFMRGDEPYKEQWNTSVRNNLEFWVTRKKIVPVVYSAVTKNNRLSGLVRAASKIASLKQSR